MTAADQENESNEGQHSHNLKQRTFGSNFAKAVIKSLTSTDGVATQPKDPNDNQVATFNAYTRSIIDTCGRDASSLWSKENFTLGAQDEEQEGAGNGRTVIPLESPLSHFFDRWGKLVDAPNAEDPTEKLRLDRQLINTETACALSGIPRGASACWREAMIRAMLIGDIRMVARLFLKTCPGDWNRGWNPGLDPMLSDVVQHGIEPQHRRCFKEIDITEFIRYRWGLAEMADSFVKEYKLRKPDHETCLFWNDSGMNDRFFTRFTRYTAAAVALTDLPEEEADRVLKSLLDRMDVYGEFYKKLCLEDEGVLQKQREWHEAIGR